MGKGQELYKKAKTMIPGGTMLLSKRPEQHLPENWPAYFSKSKGCKVWDLDGREYIDCGLMGVGTNTLGYANDYRITIDEPEDFEVIKALIENLGIEHGWKEYIDYLLSHKELYAINSRFTYNEGYAKSLQNDKIVK